MGWNTGIIVEGGELQGSVLPYSHTQFTNYNVNRDGSVIVQSDLGFTDYDLTNIYVDVPYTRGATIAYTQLAYWSLKDDQGNFLRYLCIRYKYESSITLGGDSVAIGCEVGYMDAQYNYTAMGDRGISINTGINEGVYPFKLRLHVCIGKKTDGQGEFYFFGAAVSAYSIPRNKYVYAGRLTAQTFVQGVYPESEEYSPEFGPASEPDGYGQGGLPGTHDKHSDHVGIPTKPQFGFTSAGFLNHYRISAQGLSMLGEALFPEPQGVSIDIPGAIDRLTANMWNSKIIDYIIDCRIIPVTAPATNQVNITCGGKVLVHPNTGAAYSAYLVDEDFVDVDCGVINTPLTEGNFIDFSVTRAKIFIPFYGFVDLAPEYWHGAKIGLYYRFNLMDGSFMAWLTSAPFKAELESASDMEIIGQYAGNACIHLPINSQSYSQIIGGMITTGAAIVGAAAGGAIGGAAGKTIAAGAVQTAISGAANIATGRPQLISNNSYNGSAALMSNRTPYLLIEFGEAQFSTKYTEECGLPLVVNKLIGNCSGMTVCDNAIINFACTDAEAKEILAALREGVIV